MIQLLQQTGDIAFTRNPMLYRFRSLASDGSMYGAIGVRSEVRITGYEIIPNNETITLNWTHPDGATNSITFTAKTSPSATNPLEIPGSISGYISYSEYYDAVGAKMKAHPEVGPWFKFYTKSRDGDGQSFWAEALEQNEDWVVAWDISGISSGNFAVVNDTDLTVTNMPDNYEILLEVFLQRTYRSGEYVKVSTHAAAPDANGETTFDLSEVLNSEIKESLAEPPIPAYSTTSPVKADNLRNYYVRYRENYDGIDPVAWTNSDIKKALHGGISQNMFADINFFDQLNEDNALMTWCPDKKTVGPLQPEYIHWYNYDSVNHSIILEVKTYDEDLALIATTYQHNVGSPVSAAPLEMLMIPVGLDTLGLNTSSVRKYTVQVIDYTEYNETPDVVYLSQLRTFYVDQSYRESNRYIMYLNGFGLPEVIRCTGFFTNDLQVSREEAERVLRHNYSSQTQQKYQSNVDWTNFFTYRTGFIPPALQDALQELLIYNEAFEIYEEVYIPIKIVDNRFRIAETRQGLTSLAFKAEPTLKQRNYSNRTMEFEESNWLLETEAGYWITIFGQPYGLIA